MDLCPDDLEIRPIHAGEIERRRRSVFPVRSIGYIPRKDQSVDRTFSSINFSFILSGGGHYRDGGRTHAITSPSVLTQWPRQPVHYGPGGRWADWCEIYLIYPPELAPSFSLTLMAERERPVWAIEDLDGVRQSAGELARLTAMQPAPGWIEEVDLACEKLIMRSRPLSDPWNDPEFRRAGALRREIDTAFLEISSVDELAVRRGFSRSTFRRLWPKVCEMPPQRYLTELKLKHACRLLVETNLRIGEIADAIGFADQFYFSRKFRALFGQTATDYRKQHQIYRFGKA